MPASCDLSLWPTWQPVSSNAFMQQFFFVPLIIFPLLLILFTVYSIFFYFFLFLTDLIFIIGTS